MQRYYSGASTYEYPYVQNFQVMKCLDGRILPLDTKLKNVTAAARGV